MKITKKKIAGFLLIFLLCLIQLSAFKNISEAATDLMEQQVGFSKDGTDVANVFDGQKPQDIRIVVARMIRVALGFIGMIAVVMIILAGFEYLTSQGNEEKTKEALKQITYAVVGMLIILAAFGLTIFVETMLRKATYDTPF